MNRKMTFFFIFPSNGAQVELNWQEKTKVPGEKTCPSTTLSTTNPTWTEPGSNPGLRGGRPATNRLSHGTATLTVLLPSTSTFRTFRGGRQIEWILGMANLLNHYHYQYQLILRLHDSWCGKFSRVTKMGRVQLMKWIPGLAIALQVTCPPQKPTRTMEFHLRFLSRPSLFWDVTRRRLTAVYRSFGITYRSHIPSVDCLMRKDGSIGCHETSTKEVPSYAAFNIPEERRSQLHCGGNLMSRTFIVVWRNWKQQVPQANCTCVVLPTAHPNCNITHLDNYKKKQVDVKAWQTEHHEG